MALDSIIKAIATGAWSQLVHSLVPSSRQHIRDSMRAAKSSETAQTNELENQQGIEHIQYCMRSAKSFEMVQANEHENHQGIEHIQYCIRSAKSSEMVQANEHENQQGIEHIQYCIRSAKSSVMVQTKEYENQQGIDHIQYCIRSAKSSETVQTKEHENQQGIEHIQYCMRSAESSETVQTNVHGNEQWIEHIEGGIRSTGLFKPTEDVRLINYIRESRRLTLLDDSRRSTMSEGLKEEIIYRQAKKFSCAYDELLNVAEIGNLCAEEKLIMRFEVVTVIKFLHKYGVDTIRSIVEEKLEDLNKKYEDIDKDPSLQYKKKGLEVMLRICDIQTCQTTTDEISKRGRG